MPVICQDPQRTEALEDRLRAWYNRHSKKGYMKPARILELHYEILRGALPLRVYRNKIHLKMRETIYSVRWFRRMRTRAASRGDITFREKQEGDDRKLVRLRTRIRTRPMDTDNGTRNRPIRRRSESKNRAATFSYHYIAKKQDKILGKISVTGHALAMDNTTMTIPLISGAYVSPLYRGLGIGERLYRTLLDALAKKGIKTVYQTINRSNMRNICLAYKLGFFRAEPEMERALCGEMRMYAFRKELHEERKHVR